MARGLGEDDPQAAAVAVGGVVRMPTGRLCVRAYASERARAAPPSEVG
jgi:hypothetical protein